MEISLNLDFAYRLCLNHRNSSNETKFWETSSDMSVYLLLYRLMSGLHVSQQVAQQMLPNKYTALFIFFLIFFSNSSLIMLSSITFKRKLPCFDGDYFSLLSVIGLLAGDVTFLAGIVNFGMRLDFDFLKTVWRRFIDGSYRYR